jgi:formate dehydrogenase iron-sulfur subunit
MALPLYNRAIESDDQSLVRLTLLEGGASARLVDALIPQRPLADGEQYRFHFDMTKCIGCRSCEVACNEQNGNPAEIKWRRVGELEGGVYPDTQRTYLSMGCNHCLSAECVKGCPVDAYTKDPVTGIVLHSADACIGCQYCVWNCPYSVPQFNPERGVVGKCDMCHGRLTDGLEPACVNACPENAIQIEIVNKIAWQADYASADSPGMPPAGVTVSTTRITLPEQTEAWLERVDTGSIRPESGHPSLVAMTTMVQAAVGTLAVLVWKGGLDVVTLTLLAAITAVALNVSVFHLGRPAYAWRALKMWRRSWLSREVLLFGLFFVSVGAATLTAWGALFGLAQMVPFVVPLTVAAVAFGLLGTVASAFIYLVPARPSWNMLHTPADFLLSCGMLGVVLAEALEQLAGWLVAPMQHLGLPVRHVAVHLPFAAFGALALLWAANFAWKLLRLRGSKLFELRASYNLLRGEGMQRLVAGALLAAALGLVLFALLLPTSALLLTLVAVVLGRHLFFVSVVPLNMGLTFVRTHNAGAH